MLRHAAWVWTVMVLAVLTSSAAYAFTVEGTKPSWWDNPDAIGNNIRMEWRQTWNAWYENPGGPAPNEIDISAGWSTGPFTWAFESDGNLANGDEDNPFSFTWTGGVGLDGNGFLIPADTDQSDFSLLIGNEPAVADKHWYFEFALDRLPEESDGTFWDPTVAGERTRLEWHAKAKNETGDYYEFPLKDVASTGWVKKNDGTKDYLVWWAEFYLEGTQPNIEKMEFRWDTDASTPYVTEPFYVKRITTGTACTPEPSAFVLLALSGLPIAFIRRRKKA